MCLGKPECQRCQTCGRVKYQFWIDSEMHDRGCPFGAERMDQCTDTVEWVERLRWSRDNGVKLTDRALALVEQFDALTARSAS